MSVIRVVNVVPNNHSNESSQNSEPSIAVNPNNHNEIVITAFTSPDSGLSNGPIYYSNDGGATWYLNFDVQGGMPGDQSIGFAGTSGELYAAVLRGDNLDLNVLRTGDPTATGTLPTFDDRSNIDQPWAETRSVIGGPDDGRDRLYVGYNNDGAGTGVPTASVDVCLDALATSPTFTPVSLDPRSVGAGLRDGYAIRPVTHRDGTVYVIYEGWRSGAFFGNITTDIIVARDDNWATGSPPFSSLKDPGDGLSGRIVATGVVINDGGFMGQERLNNDLAIAVDPTNSDIVCVVWCDNAGPNYTLRVRRSLNRGVAWSGDLLTVDNATMVCLAINVAGVVGLMYQRLNGGNWETHFRRTTDRSGRNWDDVTLSIAPSNSPAKQFDPYLGDWARVLATGKSFYGAFCANNTPDPANFPATPATASTPNGAIFLRNVSSTAPWNLLGNDGVTVVPASIDPFFFQVTDVPASSDFYVRDWTDSFSSADNGIEPSTHHDFWDTSDVWNQYSSSTPFPPNANDQPVGENAESGLGSAGNNYAFARIRRNTLPTPGSGPTTVSAHFLVSEFGTGSNFVDWVFSDPSDPDVTFPVASDVTVTFADTELGPEVTPAYLWTLDPTTSNHLCLAVEISAPNDPFAQPGLTGRAPGSADISIVNDNNKAQRNLQVYLAGHESRGSTYYGIIHNAATFPRDMVLQVGSAQRELAEGAFLEVITDRGAVERRPVRAWDKIVLPRMMPGENRWVGVTTPVPAGAQVPVPVTLGEMRGNAVVSGFSIAAQPATIQDVIWSVLQFHRSVFTRMDVAFHVPGAHRLAESVDQFVGGGGGSEEDERNAVDFEEKVVVTAKDVKIEVDVRVRTAGRSHDDEEEDDHRGLRRPSSAEYSRFVKQRAKQIESAIRELLRLTRANDAFSTLSAAAQLVNAVASDPVSLVTEHATVLHKLDAFMTMLQKAQGDHADILQNVRWQLDLYTQSGLLNGLSGAANIRNRSELFIQSVESRTARLGDYADLLSGLQNDFQQTADALTSSGVDLHPYVNRLSEASSARALQKAHRELLLQLQNLS